MATVGSRVGQTHPLPPTGGELEMQAPGTQPTERSQQSGRAGVQRSREGGPLAALASSDAAIVDKLNMTHAERAAAALGPRAPRSKLVRFARGTDAVQLLQRGDDKPYLKELATERQLALRFADRIDADLATHRANMDPYVHGKLTATVGHLRHCVDNVHGSAGARVALAGVFLALAAYPVALTMLSDPQEKRSFALLLASTTKSATVVLGEMARATTSLSTVPDVAKNRLWANIEQALLLTPQATRTRLGKHLSESKPFNIGIIFASFALLVAAFWGPAIARKMTQGAREMIKGKPQVPNDADTLATLREDASIAGDFHEQITDMTSAFRDHGGIVTRGANAKKSDMLAAFEDIQTTFSSAAGDRPPKLPNKDLVPKAIGSIAAVGINTAAIMTFLGEDIAVADMAADDVFTAVYLAAITRDPNKDAHDVSKGFQDWVALSAWLIPTMSVNAALHNPIATSKAAFAAYSVVLPLGNLVFSAWIGKGLSGLIGLAFDKFRGGDAEGGRAAIHEAGAFARRMIEAGLLDRTALGEEPTPEQERDLQATQGRLGMGSPSGITSEQRVTELDMEGRPIAPQGTEVASSSNVPQEPAVTPPVTSMPTRSTTPPGDPIADELRRAPSQHSTRSTSPS